MKLDSTDKAILRELQADARLSYAEIGRRVGLSSPAVQERVHKLEDAGIIKGYHAQIDTGAIGLTVRAIVLMRGSCRNATEFKEAILKMPEVMQCHYLLGENCFTLQVVAESMQQLERLIERLNDYSETETTMILSSPLERGIISPEIFSQES